MKINCGTIESICNRLKEKGVNFSLDDLSLILNLVQDEILYEYVTQLICKVEAIIQINPALSEEKILQVLARNVVEFLDAEFADVWIFDNEWKHLTSFGGEGSFAGIIPFEDIIAEEVIKTEKSYCIPDILREEKWRNKEVALRHGIHSGLFVRVANPRFSMKKNDPGGVLRIFYKEDKAFKPFEIEVAEMFSRRLNYFIARRRIMELHKFHAIKDKITECLFLGLARGEAVKMKNVFNSVIPELAEIMKIQRSSLFSVREAQKQIVLEAGYPESAHGIGKIRPLEEPYARIMVNQEGPFGEFEHEKIYSHYMLIHDPMGTSLLPPDIKHFLDINEIHSVLYIPLKVDGTVKYFLAFDAQAQHQSFTEEEIEIFAFLGKELTKGLELARMGDILHDIRNPAIAASGFAKRIRRILEEEDYPKHEKLSQAVEIVLRECGRIQALSLRFEGKSEETLLDLTDLLKARFVINEEALKEQNRDNVRLIEGELNSPLWVRGCPLFLERVLDNLFNNASNAIPEEGGEISIRSYCKEEWAMAEISNTGQIPEEAKGRFIREDGIGRGLDIISRFVRSMGGKVEVDTKEGQTTFRVMLPIAKP